MGDCEDSLDKISGRGTTGLCFVSIRGKAGAAISFAVWDLPGLDDDFEDLEVSNCEGGSQEESHKLGEFGTAAGGKLTGIWTDDIS